MKAPRKYKNFTYTIITSCIIIALFSGYQWYDDYTHSRESYEFCVSYTKKLKEVSLNAKVQGSFLRRNGRRYLFDMLLTNDGLVLIEGNSKLSEVYQNGDLIVKKANSSTVHVYRDGSKIQSLNFECQDIEFACKEGETYCQKQEAH